MAGKHDIFRRTVIFLFSILAFVLIAANVYTAGMHYLEGRERGFWESLMTVVETLTTTGYGADSHWNHPLMNAFMILLQFSGICIVLLVFPLYFLPSLEKRFEQKLPHEDLKIRDHTLIFRNSQAISTVLPELERLGKEVLIIEEDESEARWLVEGGHRVIHRQLDDDALEAGGLMRAKTLIANGNDMENASIALAARQMGFKGKILSFVTDTSFVEPLMVAGSDDVLAPRNLLAVALAARASEKVSPTIAGAHQLGKQLEIFQVRVQPDSQLANLTLQEAAIGARTGAIVIGQWLGGSLDTDTSAAMRIQPGGILVVAGSHESIEQLIDLVKGAHSAKHSEHFVVVGAGEVGSQVVELLRAAGEKVIVIDREEGDGVDFVADIQSRESLARADFEHAQAVILAIDSDISTLFATLVIRDSCAGVPILARVNEAENLEKIHRAGADFALSFSQVAGSLLARRLLGREAFELDPQLKLIKVPSGGLVGRKPSEVDIRSRTGCSVIAVERDETLMTQLSGDFRFMEGDQIYLCGAEGPLLKFFEDFSG